MCAGNLIAEGELLHAASLAQDTTRVFKLYPPKGVGEAHGVIYDDDGTASDGTYHRIDWILQTDAKRITLTLIASGSYSPACLANIRVQLPPQEQRKLVTEGNLSVNSQ